MHQISAATNQPYARTYTTRPPRQEPEPATWRRKAEGLRQPDAPGLG